MKLLTFVTDSGLKLGVKMEKGVLNLEKAKEKFPNTSIPTTIEQVIEGEEAQLKELHRYIQTIDSKENELFLPEEELTFGPIVPNPGKIICIGLNYRKHAIESGMPIPENPIIFNKFSNAISGHGETVDIPSHAKQIDYEAELVIVIGKKTKEVSKEEALDYVLGYTNGNDLSIREHQFLTSQWVLGKTADGFCPIGPYLVTPDEVGNPDDLEIKGLVNGEVKQSSTTADMIFNCSEIISFASKYMTLEPGDIILTGTPEGVIMGNSPEEQIWLKNGDEVTIEIEKLGKLTTIFN
ncbi:fumarylacetoacetate hydrolase family protein [Oceanobacillus saliphilus]|uniref:fumarylacetoacetate hydrolase family protein n=1 Tax=Oceanobacillus saliphilus TaxID=2925834 RepID=UPI00201E5842|nr:fumarylacetoacetate hydrolase family protein [Oceanobacillus saliphilus]